MVRANVIGFAMLPDCGQIEILHDNCYYQNSVEVMLGHLIL